MARKKPDVIFSEAIPVFFRYIRSRNLSEATISEYRTAYNMFLRIIPDTHIREYEPAWLPFDQP